MFYTNFLRKCNHQVCYRGCGYGVDALLCCSSRQIKQKHVSTSSQRRYISVPEFNRKKTVLITGATGFVGQALVEKILRSCPDVDQIVLPIRASKKGNVQERFNEFLKLPVFRKLSQLNPNFHEKLVPSQVDLGRSDLGLQKDVHDSLKETIEIIIHAAANTKLNGPLNEMMHANVLGTNNVLNFAKQCNNLKVLVYVSSAFSNMHLENVMEDVLQEGFSTTDMLNLASTPNHAFINKRATDLRGSQITYVFSKRIAEQLIAEKQGHIPVIILRPSMITAAFAEPFPTWSYGKLAYNGIIHMLAGKMLPYIPGYPEVEIEMVPVDFVVNAIITSAWMLGTGQRFETNHQVEIVNSYYESVENTSYRIKLVRNLIVFEVLYLIRCLPSCLVKDIDLQREGRNGRNTRRLLMQIKQMEGLSLSTFRNIAREYNHCVQLASRLSTIDKKTFNTNIRDIDWRSYIHAWLKTTKRNSDIH